jgi:hypothetical protein
MFLPGKELTFLKVQGRVESEATIYSQVER